MTLLERLRILTALDAISGHEQPVVRTLRDALAHLCDDVEVDAAGTLYAIRRGAEPGPTVLVAAHTD
jgi:putative aminopeptidase